MIVRIAIEIALGLITFIAGGLFWQLRKRARFLAEAIHSEPLLQQFISRQTLDTASPMVTPLAEKKITYALNIQLVVDADAVSQRRTMFIFVFILTATLVGSYFLGVWFLAINVVLLFLSAFSPISPSARSNALQHILALALILHRWRAENPRECDEWVARVPSLEPIYNAVRLVQ
jgi:uncharacterized membrane protein YwzB